MSTSRRASPAREMGGIADRLHSAAIHLVRDGLAVREADRDDARAVIVRATPEGRRTLRRGRAQRLEALEASLRELSERELRALGGGVDVLERILREP